MSQDGERLKKIFNSNQNIESFKSLVRTMKRQSVKLSYINDLNQGPAFYSRETLGPKIISRRILVNLAFSDEAIKIALDHEGTHAQQDSIESVFANNDYNLESRLCLDLLGEVHAFSNQCEFAIDRYLQKLQEGNADNTLEEKAFNGFFESGKSVEGKHFLKAYINAMTDGKMNVSNAESSKDITEALKYYHYAFVQTGNSSEQNKINGRKAVLKKFFESEPLIPGIPNGTQKNNDLLETYIGNITEYASKYCRNFANKTKQIELDMAVMVFTTGEDLFLQPEDYEEILGVETLDAYNRKVLMHSKYIAVFSAVKNSIKSLASQQNPWQKDNPFNFTQFE